MPAQIINAVISYIQANTTPKLTVWDGEIPRYDTGGNPIFPGALTTPTVWPVFQVKMPESGFKRTWTTEDAYDDLGELTVTIYAITRADVEKQMNVIEALLATGHGWADLSVNFLAGANPGVNPYYIIQMLLDDWYCIMEEGVRTAMSDYLYRGGLIYRPTHIHGAISTY